jgi:SAM-dependent methyltransferase
MKDHSTHAGSHETQSVRERYARRPGGQDARYSLLNPAALAAWQERQRATLALFRRLGWTDLSQRSLLEVGSGTGSNLLEAILVGFMPPQLMGIELLAERHAQARERLPETVRLVLGDASTAALQTESFDVVMQATVFSSLLDDGFQQSLAGAMWRAVKPGGGVLWYDFTVDNPRNRDVRGVPLRRVRELFPQGRLQARRITLAPPVARAVSRLHPALYTVFNLLPVLRTHLLCWIAKD